jgi:uncharacterized membrane protein
MRLWLIPVSYVAISSICAFVLPRLENAYLGHFKLNISVASAHAVLSATASGMMALTAIVFAVAFVLVQFGASAYSPRVVLWLTRDRTLFHTLGIFIATFIYSLWVLAWIDRGGTGSVPMLSVMVVGFLVIFSMILFARMVDRLNELQINNVLYSIGDGGRDVIKSMFQPLTHKRGNASSGTATGSEPCTSSPTQTLKYSGPPLVVASFDTAQLVEHARKVQGTIVMKCAVGDTLVEGVDLLAVHGASAAHLLQGDLTRAIRLARERTFEQDPKYPIRLLVDIAIRALSPAVNDPTTAVQTIDQIEDLLLRLGQSDLDAGRIRDQDGTLRLVYPVPTWGDYLALAFDEIRQYGAGSVQVMRRLRSALVSIGHSLSDESRIQTVQRYIDHLNLTIDHSPLDSEDRALARQEDRQGIGLSRPTT